jgi:hypothetical protein
MLLMRCDRCFGAREHTAGLRVCWKARGFSKAGTILSNNRRKKDFANGAGTMRYN